MINYSKDLLIQPYSPNEIVYMYDTPGTYPLNLKSSGYYKLEIVGGGGQGSGIAANANSYYSGCGGGSGAGFVGEIYLNQGNYSATVGGQAAASTFVNSNNTTLITAGGGTNAKLTNYNLSRSGGNGGTLTVDNSLTTRNVEVQSNGNKGNFTTTLSVSGNVKGGASVYEGYGKGGDGWKTGRTDGYFKLTYKGN